MVELVREPNNQYDNWAIRVDNVRRKQGHAGWQRAFGCVAFSQAVLAAPLPRPAMSELHTPRPPALLCNLSWQVRGQKVGHLPRVLVCHLSPLVDAGSLHLEGLVPRGGGFCPWAHAVSGWLQAGG